MDREAFKNRFMEIMDKECNYLGSGSRTFVENERLSFEEKMWEFFQSEGGGNVDFESPPFIFALQRAKRKSDSVQVIAAALGDLFKEEVAKAAMAMKKKN